MNASERLTLDIIENNSDDSVFNLAIDGKAATPFTKSEVLFAQTEAGDAVVVKFSAYSWGAEREWLGMKKLYKAKIPIPTPLALIQKESSEKGIVSARIFGNDLYHTQQPMDELKYRLGLIIKTIHNNVVISGDEWMKSDKPSFEYYDKKRHRWVNSQQEELKEESTGVVLFDKFSKAIIDELPNVEPAFIHHDLHDAQVLVTENGDIMVIDFEFWQEDSPLNDFANYLFHSIRTKRPEEDFINFTLGYFGDSSPSSLDKNFIAFYLINVSLSGLYYYLNNRPTELREAQLYLSRVQEYLLSEKLWKKF